VRNAIEQAARGLCSLAGHTPDELVDGRPIWRTYLPHVRIVLKAIRHPTDALLDAGMCSQQQWEAMIESALEECGGGPP